jgi:arylsulfatase A-like enzyme
MLPTLLGEKQNTNDRFLYWEFFGRTFRQAVRWRNYKAIRQAPSKPLELYDLAQDVAEEHDIAGQRPEVVATVEEYLRTARADSPNWPLTLDKDEG